MQVEWLAPVLSIVGMIAWIGFVIWLARTLKRKQLTKHVAFAEELGFHLAEPLSKKHIRAKEFTIESSWGGKAILLNAWVVRHGKNSTAYTALQVAVKNPKNLTFSISQEIFLHKWAEKIGIKEVKIDDPMFDEKFYLRTNQAELFKRFLGSTLRQDLMGFNNGGYLKGAFSANESTLFYTEIGYLNTEEKTRRYEQARGILIKLAQAVEKL